MPLIGQNALSTNKELGAREGGLELPVTVAIP